MLEYTVDHWRLEVLQYNWVLNAFIPIAKKATNKVTKGQQSTRLVKFLTHTHTFIFIEIHRKYKARLENIYKAKDRKL